MEAHGQEERDEHGDLVGTRVSVRLDSKVLTSGTSGPPVVSFVMFYAAVPVTEAETYVSNQIVEDVKAQVKVETWMPSTVRRVP